MDTEHSKPLLRKQVDVMWEPSLDEKTQPYVLPLVASMLVEGVMLTLYKKSDAAGLRLEHEALHVLGAAMLMLAGLHAARALPKAQLAQRSKEDGGPMLRKLLNNWWDARGTSAEVAARMELQSFQWAPSDRVVFFHPLMANGWWLAGPLLLLLGAAAGASDPSHANTAVSKLRVFCNAMASLVMFTSAMDYTLVHAYAQHSAQAPRHDMLSVALPLAFLFLLPYAGSSYGPGPSRDVLAGVLSLLVPLLLMVAAVVGGAHKGYPSPVASLLTCVGLLVLHLVNAMQLDRLQAGAGGGSGGSGGGSGGSGGGGAFKDATGLGEWWVGAASGGVEYAAWLLLTLACLYHHSFGSDVQRQLASLLALYEREALHPSEDATGRARSVAEAHAMRDDPLRKYQRQLLRDVVLPDVHRAAALLLLGVFFLMLASQANLLQLSLSSGGGGGNGGNGGSSLLTLYTLIAYVVALGGVALGTMRSAAGGDRLPDGARAPAPNPNPLADYPHGYQAWLTPGPNWGY